MSLEEAVGAVIDPELGRTIGSLGMLQAIEGSDGNTRVSLLLPGPGYPRSSAEELRRMVVEAVPDSGGGRRVDVDFDVMDEEGQERVADLLVGQATPAGSEASGGGGHAHAHAAGSPGQELAAHLGSRTRVLAIASGKGGVGKSSVTVNLAVVLARRGLSVGILDADVYGFSVPGMLGVTVPPLAIGRLIVPPRAHGVRCLSMGYFVPEDKPVIWRGPMLHKALAQFLTDTYWADPDFVLVDMPPGTGDVTLTMAQYLPAAEVFVVTTPQPAARRVAQRSAAAARTLRLPLRGVIENMSWFTGDDGRRYEIFGSGGGQTLADQLGVPLVGQLPLVPALREGGDVGMPVTVSEPDGEAARAFGALGDAVVALKPPRRYSSELKVR